MQINDSNQTEWGNINFAIWKIFDSSVEHGRHAAGNLGTAILV